MADMSKFDLSGELSPRQLDEYVAAFKDNADHKETALSLPDRLRDAENLWRYFTRRDEMNAEVHLPEGGEPNVRYSPITLASERVAGWLARMFYGDDVEYSVSTSREVEIVESDAKSEALDRAEALWHAVEDMLEAPAYSPSSAFEVDPAVARMARLTDAMNAFEAAASKVKRADTEHVGRHDAPKR